MRKTLALAGLLASLAPATLLAQTPQPPPARVLATREGSTRTIVIQGRIAPETEAAFAAALAANRGARVLLNSGGGSLTPALAIGRLIRENRLETFVPDGSGCFSACGLIWLAGTERHIGQGARVGFHAAYVSQQGGPGAVSSSGNAVIGAYLSRLGFNDGAIRFFTAAPPNQILVVKPDQFQQHGVAVRQTASRLPALPGAPGAPSPAPTPAGLVGVWVGPYQCGKDSGVARMSIREEGPSRFSAKFDFGPAPGAAPGATPASRGFFSMQGQIENGAIQFRPEGTPSLPGGARALSLQGTISGDTFAARIVGPQGGCAPVTLQRLRG